MLDLKTRLRSSLPQRSKEKGTSQKLYLYFYLMALLSGRVRITDGDCWLLLNSQSHVITKQLHQLWKVAAWLISTNCF
jgi:hypothetical protein